jgi:hypothetical protein
LSPIVRNVFGVILGVFFFCQAETMVDGDPTEIRRHWLHKRP